MPIAYCEICGYRTVHAGVDDVETGICLECGGIPWGLVMTDEEVVPGTCGEVGKFFSDKKGSELQGVLASDPNRRSVSE